MATKWQEKGIGVLKRRGTSEKKPVLNEETGKVGGYHVEHWDDSQDAVAQPDTVRVKVKADLDKED